MKEDIGRVDREEVARIRPEFHIDCYMILLPSAKGGWHPPFLRPVGRIRNTKIMSLAAIDVIAGDLSPTPLGCPSLAPRQISAVTIFHDCLTQIISKNPGRWKLRGTLRVFSFYFAKCGANRIIGQIAAKLRRRVITCRKIFSLSTYYLVGYIASVKYCAR